MKDIDFSIGLLSSLESGEGKVQKEELGALIPGVIFGIAFLGFSKNVASALNKSFMFTLLSSYTESAFIKGAVLSLEGLFGLLVPPLVGYYSDIATFKSGRRKPFIVFAGIGGGITLILLYLSYAVHLSLMTFIMFTAFFYIMLHIYTVEFKALMPDLIKSGSRGRASGFITAFQLLGTIAGTLIGAALWIINEGYPFLFGGILMITSAILTYFEVEELGIKVRENRERFKKYILEIGKHRDFLKFYLSQVLMFMAYEMITLFFMGVLAFIVYGSTTDSYVKAITPKGVVLIAFFSLTAVLGAVIGGQLYDKVSRKWTILTGAFVFALPLALGALAQTLMEVEAAVLIAGFGWGVLLTSTYPVVADLLTEYEREEAMGGYYGMYEAMKAFPILAAGTIGGALVDLAAGNYRIILPIAALLISFSLPLVWSIEALED